MDSKLDTPRSSAVVFLLATGLLLGTLAPPPALAHEITPDPADGIVVQVGKTAKLKAEDLTKCKAFLAAVVNDTATASVSNSPSGAKIAHTWTVRGLQPGVTFVTVGIQGTGTNPQGESCNEVSTTLVPIIVLPDLSSLSKEFKGCVNKVLSDFRKEVKGKLKLANALLKTLIADFKEGNIGRFAAFDEFMVILGETQSLLEECAFEAMLSSASKGSQLLDDAGIDTTAGIPDDLLPGGCGTLDKALQKTSQEIEKACVQLGKIGNKAGKSLEKAGKDDGLDFNLVMTGVNIYYKPAFAPGLKTEQTPPTTSKPLRMLNAGSLGATTGQENGVIGIVGLADPAAGNIEVTLQGPGPTTKMLTVTVLPNTCMWVASSGDLAPGLWTIQIQHAGDSEPRVVSVISVGSGN